MVQLQTISFAAYADMPKPRFVSLPLILLEVVTSNLC